MFYIAIMNNSINFKSSFYIDFNRCPNSKRYEAYEIAEIADIADIADEEDCTAYFSEDSSNYYATCSMPDKKDYLIETYLKNLGINYRKLTNEELFSEKSIKARMEVPGHRKNTHKIVNVKPKAFEELFKENKEYLGEYPMDQPERYDRFKDYLKTYQPITASEVYLREENGNLSVSFQDGRHRYCVFRDMKFSSIPLAMNQESIELARKYNLLAE